MDNSFKGFVFGVIATLLVGLVIWLVAVYTGAYNVAATDPHADFMRWTLDTMMDRSVDRRSDDIDLPENVPENLVAAGAKHYSASCVYCHGAPGQEPTGWSRGMLPKPPHLSEAATKWSAEEIYWIVQNGIKMSGMPAFGPRHETEDIKAVTAFVTKLPGLTPERYDALTRGGDQHGQGADHDGAQAAPAAGDQAQTEASADQANSEGAADRAKNGARSDRTQTEAPADQAETK